MVRIRVIEGDLTAQEVDAIVNAANTRLVLGSGVAGAIRQRGGPEIQKECDAHGPVPLGSAAVTSAGALPARFVIHAASMELGQPTTEKSLRASVRASLERARSLGLQSIAFPALGTGVGGFSMQRCAEILFEESRAEPADGSLEEILLVPFGEPAYRIFEQVQDAERIRVQMKKLGR